jgi:hypothetical protein
MKRWVVVLLLGLAYFAWPTVRDEVQIGEQSARVARAPGDGLDGIASPTLSLDIPEALASCASEDIKKKCCPVSCNANKTDKNKANKILRGCMKDLGCVSGLSDATVFSYCSCSK